MIVGRILRAEESTDGYKNIKIIVEFLEDSKVLVPEWVLYARFENFLGMTAAEISEWIRINIEYQIGNLIKERAKAPLNAEFMAAIEKLKSEKIFHGDTVEIPMEANPVTSTAYKVLLNADGTYSTDRAK